LFNLNTKPMTRFNRKTTTQTVNLAGGQAYSETPELHLVSILLTSFAQDQFYRSADNTFQELSDLLQNIDSIFAAKAGIYARTKFGMRSITHVLAAKLAKHIKGKNWAKDFYDHIIYRPDDMMEILSYYKSNEGKSIPNAMKKGFAKAFNRFDEYQLSKYRGEGKGIKLIDIVNLVHPVSNEKNADALKKLVAGKLKSETWESQLTKAGQVAGSDEEKADLKKEVWVQLIKEKKIGYFALLKNLRNILEQAPEVKIEALELLRDEGLIKKSLVLPFRYFTAIKEISDRETTSAISDAAEISLNNIPEFPGRTLIMIDVSYSMGGRPEEIARMFGAVLYKRLDSDVITFDNNARYIKGLNPNDSLLSIMNGIPFTGGGTDLQAAFMEAHKPYDRIIVLSDMQAWGNSYSWYRGNPNEAFRDYKTRTGADSLIYSFDLAGYGSLQFPERNIFCLAGFSDKVFDIMKFLETDKKALISEINKIKL